MNENSDLLPNLLHEEFEMQMRGYSRRQVDDFVARRNAEIRELEQRLARTLDESEQLRRELSTVRQQALGSRPAHEEVSERIAQILKLADDEANAQRNKADDEIARLRTDAQQETERVRTETREQADRLLTAAQEQAERTISAARAEADKTRTAAHAETDRLTSETRKKADAALANAKAQAKKVLDEATARATAIHDGAERRLNLLSTRHTETVRRLEDILDGVQGLVSAEAARMSLEEEVAQTVSKAISIADVADPAETDGRTSGHDRPDLARLAPPTPETVTNGNIASSGNGSDSLEDPIPDLAGPAPDSGAAGSGRFPLGQPGVPMPPVLPMPGNPARLGPPAPQGPPRSALPIPGGSPHPGPGPVVAAGSPPPIPGHGEGPRQQERDAAPDSDRPGIIDPDEPTEGIRLMR
jgi:cell division septum initiation protein DivIVA